MRTARGPDKVTTSTHFQCYNINRGHFCLCLSGDDSVTLAGGRAKFVTEISVANTGHCVWSGPATFKASCEMAINQWPFDTQTCELGFGSFTYGIGRMNIKLFQDSKGQFTSKSFVSCQCAGYRVSTC